MQTSDDNNLDDKPCEASSRKAKRRSKKPKKSWEQINRETDRFGAWCLGILIYLCILVIPVISSPEYKQTFATPEPESEAEHVIIRMRSGKEYDLGPRQSSSSSASSSSASSDSSNYFPQSTRERTPLPPLLAEGSQYYTDEDGTLITDPLVLEHTLMDFHKKTGVKPYVYILSKDDPVIDSAEEYVKKGIALYDELFDDEAHLLMLYAENDARWTYTLFTGKDAQTVMDQEARDILDAYMRWYNIGLDYPLETVFIPVFTKAADRIMSKPAEETKPIASFATVMVGVGTLLALLAVVRIVRIRYRAKRDAERDEFERKNRILTLPLDQLGNEVFDED